MQTSLSPTVCRAFLGCQIEKAVDELNLTKKIISCLCLVTILPGCEINNFAGQSAKSVCYNLVAMFDLFRLWLGAVLRGFRTRRSLMLENVVLRQQLAVFKRQQPRPRLGAMDKLVRVVARRFWAHTSPATILRKMGFIAGAPQTQRRFGDGEPNELA
jgi:hypothetical protein